MQKLLITLKRRL